jgi:hypothetical protein
LESLQVLLTHVVEEDLNASSLLDAVAASSPSPANLTSLDGSILLVALSGDDLYLNPEDTDINATVTKKDLETCAGIVHVIDKVLVPAEMPAAVNSTCTPLETALADAGMDSIVTLLSMLEVHCSTFALSLHSLTSIFFASVQAMIDSLIGNLGQAEQSFLATLCCTAGYRFSGITISSIQLYSEHNSSIHFLRTQQRSFQ